MLDWYVVNAKRLQHRDWLEKLKTEGKISKDLPEAPEVSASAFWLWEAYSDLAGQRQHGELPQPITVVDIEAYARIYDYDDSYSKQRLLKVILKLDRHYLEHTYKQIAAERKQQALRNNSKAGARR